MDNSSCWCYLCSQRVTPVVESDGGIRCPHCQDRFVERMGGRSSSPVDRLPLWSPSLLGLVSGGFSALDEEAGWRREGMLFGLDDFSLRGDRREGMLFGLADFSLRGDRSDAVADFALTLADYLLEGEKGVRRDHPRRLKLNRARVCESGEQCCICLEDFELGEEAEETQCKHRFHGCCIGSWLKRGNGTCPMCRCRISDAREGKTERFAFAYSRERNSLRHGGRRVWSRIQGIRNYLGRWSPV